MQTTIPAERSSDGEVAAIGEKLRMSGRSRPYTVSGPFQAQNSALAVAFNDRCDAIVATAVVARDRPTALEPIVIGFLNSETVMHWAEVTLGL